MLSKMFAAERLQRASASPEPPRTVGAAASLGPSAPNTQDSSASPPGGVASAGVPAPVLAPVRISRALESEPVFYEGIQTFVVRGRERGFVDSSVSIMRGPTTLGKALLAEDYHRRYGVEIFIVPYWRDIPDVARALFRARPEDFKLGLIVHAGGDRDHAASFLLARRQGLEYAAAFDSVAGGNCLQPTFRALQKVVYEAMWVEAAGRGWQADKLSCHTGAMVVLKDLLRRPDPVADLGRPSEHRDHLAIHKMPSFLLKIAQRSEALEGVKMSDAVGFGPNAREKTLGAHRAAHTREVELEPGPEERSSAQPNARETRRLNVYALQKGHTYAARAERLRRELLESPEGPAKLRTVWEARVLGVLPR